VKDKNREHLKCWSISTKDDASRGQGGRSPLLNNNVEAEELMWRLDQWGKG